MFFQIVYNSIVYDSRPNVPFGKGGHRSAGCYIFQLSKLVFFVGNLRLDEVALRYIRCYRLPYFSRKF